MAGTGDESLHTLVVRAVEEDLEELQRVRAGPPPYNKSWLAERINEQGTLSFAAAKNLLSPSGRLPIKSDGLRLQLAAIQSALDVAFGNERSRGVSGPHNYSEFLAEIPSTGPRRARFPSAPPEECEAPDTEPAPSARIDELFRLAANDLRPERVNRYLREVLSEAESLDAPAARHAVRSRCYAALAVEASTARERRKWWQEALRSSRREIVESPGLDAVRRRALLAVDATSDRLAAFELSECHRELAAATRDIDAVLSHSEHPQHRSALLAAKAMVQRHRGQHERLPSSRDTFLDSSIRCAEAAVREHPLPASVLELGLCIAQRSGTTKDLERRQEMVGVAEGHLIRAVERGAGEVGRLALASFYRHMHRPMDAVDAFPLDGPHANYRRLLREAPVLAEAAIELHYNGYPNNVAERALEDARALLDDAHRGGYGWARHLVDLAFVRAILDGPAPHETVLAELFDDSGDTDWTHVAELASDSGESIEQESFALGVDDSAVWNRLGTYALDFLGDEALAERLYRQSIRFGSNSHLPMTNLARLLIRRGEPAGLREAWKLLQEVTGSAPPSSPWWRRERDSLADAVARLPPEDQFPAPRPRPPKLVAKATAARALEDPAEGRDAIADVVAALVAQCSLPRAGELAVIYRTTVVRFEVLWSSHGSLANLYDEIARLDQTPEVLVVLSHDVDESIEAAVREQMPGGALVTAAELDAIAAGLEQLPALIARKSFERLGADSRWSASVELGRFL